MGHPAFAEATADKGAESMGREASPRWRIEVGGWRQDRGSQESGARRHPAFAEATAGKGGVEHGVGAFGPLEERSVGIGVNLCPIAVAENPDLIYNGVR